MIFEVKMDFRRKARYVANGAKNPNLKTSSYSGVVPRETVHITLTYGALNGLNVMSADIQNAYLQTPISEKYLLISSNASLGNSLIYSVSSTYNSMYSSYGFPEVLIASRIHKSGFAKQDV